MTLFHHSLPLWAKDEGGFTNHYIAKLFIDFDKKTYDKLRGRVDYSITITINEPSVYAMLTHVVGLWPSGFEESSPFLGFLNLGFFKGRAVRASEEMAKTHIEIYNYIHSKNDKEKVSITKNIANYKYDNFSFIHWQN